MEAPPRRRPAGRNGGHSGVTGTAVTAGATWLGWVVLAVFFAGIWVYALYREDRKNPEPLFMVLLAVAGGVGAELLADWLEWRLVPDISVLDGTLAERARTAFLVAGPVEELCKMLAVVLLVWPWSHFDEPVDGLVYGAAAGAGFALAENLAFMQLEPEVILSRGPVGTGAHVLFAVIWGGALGHAGHVKNPAYRWAIVSLGVLLAAFAHGLFDIIVFSVGKELTLNQGRAAQIVLVGFCLLFLRWRLHVALKQRPFRFRKGATSAAVSP